MILQGFCNPARKLAVSPTPILLIGVRLMSDSVKCITPLVYSIHAMFHTPKLVISLPTDFHAQESTTKLERFTFC